MAEPAPFDNPVGTDGFEFIEFAAPDPKELHQLFRQMEFTPIAKHRSKAITLYQQGQIHFLLNEEKNSFASRFTEQHGPCVCGMAFRVKDAQAALSRAKDFGARPLQTDDLAVDYPTVAGIGNSALYFIDDGEDFYKKEFVFFSDHPHIARDPISKVGFLGFIDHLTHTVYPGSMQTWFEFYQGIFNFREIRYFDIDRSMTGLVSRALTSPCNKIRIALNGSKDQHSQIQEYLREYKGEGIQHIALHTTQIYDTIERFKEQGLQFLEVPDTYYSMVDKRLPGHGEDLVRLKQDKILIDGDIARHQSVLLQLFTQNVIGPIFFEIVQRKGNEGFGEGNFKALFEAIKRDQVERGILETV